jgi:hypothetical protein
MRQLKLIAMACTVAFALVAITAASASAFVLPEVLGPAAEAKFTTKDDLANPTFSTLKGSEVTCEHWSGEGGFEAGTRTLGLFHITFSGKCKGTISGIKAACTGLGDAAETVLVLGKWHTVVDTKPGETLGAAIMLLLEPVHMTCSIALVELTGDILCLILEPLVSMVTHLFHCTQTNGTMNEKHFLNDAGAETAVPALLTSVSHATAEESSITALGTITYAVPATIDD